MNIRKVTIKIIIIFAAIFYCSIIKSQVPEFETWDMGKYTTYYKDPNCSYPLRFWQNDTLNYCFEDWSCKEVHNGLTGTQIWDIEIDSVGNTWLATGSGLAKLDTLGNWEYFNFKNSPLTVEQIVNVAVDRIGNIWIKQNTAIFMYDGVNWTMYDQTNTILPNYFNSDILVDYDNNIWVRDYNFAYMFDGVSFQQFTLSYSNWTNHMALSPDSSVWITSNAGVWQYDGTNWTQHTPFNTINMPDSTLQHIAFDSLGNLWASDIYNYAKFDGSTWTTYTNSDRINDLEVGTNGYIYLATNGGIKKTNGSTLTNYTTSNTNLHSNYNYSLHCNLKTGKVLVGSLNELVSFTNPFSMTGYTSSNSVPGEKSKDITVVNHQKWVATSNGIARIDSSNNVVIYNKSNGLLVSNDVELICSDSIGNIWCWISGFGLYQFDGTNWNNIPGLPSNTLFNDMAADNNGNIWLSHDYLGLIKYDGILFQTFNTSNSGISSNQISAFFIQQNGNIAIATNYGISIFDGINNWTNYNTSNSNITTNITHGICEDSGGKIWVTGNFNGIIEFDGVNWYTHINNGPWYAQFDLSHGLRVDKYDNIWIGTKYLQSIGVITGLQKFDGVNTWEIYNSGVHPVNSNFINNLEVDYDGNIYVCTDKGILKHNVLNEMNSRISGYIFDDVNVNGIKDSLDYGLFGEMVILLPDSSMTMTGASGKYQFRAPFNNYIVEKPTTGLNFWTLSTSDTIGVSTSLFNPVSTDNNFGFESNVDTSKVIADFITFGSHCGVNIPSWIAYQNTGTEICSGKVFLILPDSFEFISSVPYPDSLVYDTLNAHYSFLSWNYNNLYPSQSRIINLTLNLPGVSMMGDTLISEFGTYIDQNTNNILSYVDTTGTYLTCSYDPNDKSVFPVGEDLPHYTLMGEKLEYTIRFQNTGNDTAYYITIIDTLDNNLDRNSFKFLSTSHTVGIDINSSGIISFNFDSIYLPDSTTNFIESQGYVKFSVNHKNGLNNYTEINNTAYIYFESNPAIVTNTTLNTMVYTTQNSLEEVENKNLSLKIYPNPFHNTTNIVFSQSIDKTILLKVFDQLGRTIIENKIIAGTDKVQISRKNLTNGMYFINLIDPSSNKQIYTGKILIY